MNKKGFTLIELLAVIVVLGVVMTIAGMSVSKIRKDAVKKELEHIENSITKVGDSVFSYEMLAGNNENNSFKTIYNSLGSNDEIKVSLKELQEKQYLKGIDVTANGTFKSPDGKSTCEGYLSIKKGPVIKGYISCLDYETNGYNINNNDNYVSLTSSN